MSSAFIRRFTVSLTIQCKFYSLTKFVNAAALMRCFCRLHSTAQTHESILQVGLFAYAVRPTVLLYLFNLSNTWPGVRGMSLIFVRQTEMLLLLFHVLLAYKRLVDG